MNGQLNPFADLVSAPRANGHSVGNFRVFKRNLHPLDIFPTLVLISFITIWFVGAGRANFWADDFIFLTSFNQNFGSLLGTDVTVGRITVNIFFYIVSSIFGISNPLPFIILSALVLFSGIGIFLKLGHILGLWTSRSAIWILSASLATGVFYPSIFTPGMINHNAAFLFLSAAIYFEAKSSFAENFKGKYYFIVLSGLSWLLILVTNPLYVGLLPLSFAMVLRTWYLNKFVYKGKSKSEYLVKSVFYLVLPLAHFFLFSQPATTRMSAYSDFGPEFIFHNLRIYQGLLAPNKVFVVSYIIIFLTVHVIALHHIYRKVYTPATLLFTADLIIILLLVQSQQVYIQYWIMPVFLLFSALACGLDLIVFQNTWRFRFLVLSVLSCLILVIPSGSQMSRYFSQEPWGYKLGQFRSEIALVVPQNSKLCVEFDTSEESKNFFLGGMAWSSGFVVPPINVSSVEFSAINSCRNSNSTFGIRISEGINGEHDYQVEKINVPSILNND